MTVTRGSIDTKIFNALNNKTMQMWMQTSNSSPYPSGEQGLHLARGGLINNPFSYYTPSTWGYNTFVSSDGIKLRYNQANLSTLSGTTLTFYKPSTSSTGNKMIELNTSGLTFYSPSSTNDNLKKLMELTTSSLNFYDKDDSTNPIAQYNGSGVLLGKANENNNYNTLINNSGLTIRQNINGTQTNLAQFYGDNVLLGKESVNNSYNTLINSSGLTIRRNISGTQKNLAQFYGTGFAFTNTNDDNIISGGSVPSSQVYQFIYNEKTITGKVPAGNTDYILYIKFPEYTGSSPEYIDDNHTMGFNGIGIANLGITVGNQGGENYQRRYSYDAKNPENPSWTDFTSDMTNVKLMANWSSTDKMPILCVRFINYADQNYTIQFLKTDTYDDPPENIPAYYIIYTKPSSANFIIGTQGRLPDHAVGTGMIRYNSNKSNAISEWVIDAAGNTFVKDLYLNNHSGPIGTLTKKTKSGTPYYSWSGAADKWVNDDEPQLYLTPGTYVVTASARIDTGSSNSGKFGICIGHSTSDGAWSRYTDSRVVCYNNQNYMILTTTIGVSVDTSSFFSPFYYSSNNNNATVTYQAIRAVRIC